MQISNDDLPVKLHNDTRDIDFIIPGIFKSLSVGGKVLIDSQSKEGEGKEKDKGGAKMCRGYDDKTVSLRMALLNDDELTAYEKLTRLESVFMKTKDNVPDIFTLISEHLKARNVQKCIFTSLNSSESNENDLIEIELEFTEFIPPQSKDSIVNKESKKDSKDKDFVKNEDNAYSKGMKKALESLGVN